MLYVKEQGHKFSSMNFPLNFFEKFAAKCLMHSLCSTPWNTTSTADSSPLHASVWITRPGGCPIRFFKFCKNQVQLSIFSDSKNPNATGKIQFQASTAHAMTSWTLYQVKLPMDEAKRGDAFRGIPKLRLFVALGFYVGVPWASPSLGTCHSLFHNPSNLYPKTWKLHNTKLNRKSHELR